MFPPPFQVRRTGGEASRPQRGGYGLLVVLFAAEKGVVDPSPREDERAGVRWNIRDDHRECCCCFHNCYRVTRGGGNNCFSKPDACRLVWVSADGDLIVNIVELRSVFFYESFPFKLPHNE